MGKKQHQSDKMYITATEWTHLYGGKKPTRELSCDQKDYRRLPLDHCAFSLQPFDNPYCDNDGNIFDLSAIVPFIRKYKKNPVSGKTLEARHLLKLKFTKNSQDKFHCPVLFKTFNNNSHIAAIKTTGHVFSYEAIEELNIKTKNWKELLNDTPFTRNDIIVIQDPKNVDKFNLANYYHIKNGLKLDDDDGKDAKDPKNRIRKINAETAETLAELDRTYVEQEKEKKEEAKADIVNRAHYTTGKVSASFTSTAMERSTVSEPAILEDDVVRYARVKKKAYVRIATNVGNLNLELNSDHVPKASENFIKLCQNGYYNNTVFHRSIRHFMIQGGDPKGDGTGGDSYWKKPFKDEFKPFLSHSGRGILSMANSGENSNKSQFFITYRSCKHLDNKHTVFGKVVGGLDTLANMERIETDNKDRPIEDIRFERATVFVDPFTEVDEELAKEREEENNKNQEKEEIIKKKNPERKVYTSGIGKFINPSLKKEARKLENSSDHQTAKKKKKTNYNNFTNFDSW